VAVALRTYRFIGESRTAFLVRECADPSRVLVAMEREGARHERCHLLLSAADWRQLRALNPFGARATRRDGVRLELHFSDDNDYGDSLTIARSAGSARVSVRMQCGAPGREDIELRMELTRWQWRYLTALDVVAPLCAQRHHTSRTTDARPPSHLLRVVPRAQPSVAPSSEPQKS
jgi:hypothetical protein